MTKAFMSNFQLENWYLQNNKLIKIDCPVDKLILLYF